jgi:hypothetical protein
MVDNLDTLQARQIFMKASQVCFYAVMPMAMTGALVGGLYHSPMRDLSWTIGFALSFSCMTAFAGVLLLKLGFFCGASWKDLKITLEKVSMIYVLFCLIAGPVAWITFIDMSTF